MARHARNPTVIWGAAAMGRFQIKIKSADQKTADFVIEKDVRAGATATSTAKPYSVKGGRFYGFGEAPKTAFDWYSLRFFMSEKAIRASLRPMMTRA